ncbi:hypothetical protein K458DRAFT_127231 [Lentithecium fluviatile CBS 122367]|uniref:Uncharacterized protein n=1 Tax=Lentithecium fluviatile CBS 122367 TaxID=1168545 RepID=A0A6G1JFZ1_9PLEO|nr:hypothetical protein K458DRAFT_127231 [Lentithecium fluviatile CBS 122367]
MFVTPLLVRSHLTQSCLCSGQTRAEMAARQHSVSGIISGTEKADAFAPVTPVTRECSHSSQTPDPHPRHKLVDFYSLLPWIAYPDCLRPATPYEILRGCGGLIVLWGWPICQQRPEPVAPTRNRSAAALCTLYPICHKGKPPSPERVPKYGRVDETLIAVYERVPPFPRVAPIACPPVN